MPSIIKNLIPEPQKLITVTENDSAQYALSLMIEHDFSQLPVRDGNQKLKGMITSDSILRAVSYFKVIPEKLKVSHAMIVKATAHRDEDDLSDLLRGLHDTSAIPIVDGSRKVIAIVTNYDTAEYFRHRAADLMLAENIELTLRDLILSASDCDAETDNEAMTELIKAAMPSDKEQKKKFKSALMHYINQSGSGNHIPDPTLLDSVFDQHLKESAPKKTFKKLTLSELIRIVQNLWDTYQADFNGMSWEVVGPLLDDVRKTRNAIAHFDEVTDDQRKRLQFCADFLDNHSPSSDTIEAPRSESFINPINSYGNMARVVENMRTALNGINNTRDLLGRIQDMRSIAEIIGSGNVKDSSDEPNPVPPVAEEVGDNDSRYAPLAIWLQAQDEDRVTYTFREIETIIGDELPPSARNNRSWWANDVGHTQSMQWLEVGWRVSSVNMSAERVVFSRMEGRQKAYIDFFGRLQAKLQSIEALSITPQNNPQGKSWLSLAIKPTNYDHIKPPYINFSFARRSRFRIEIYIYEGEQSRTKQIFDQLQAQKTEIETEFGAAISWERLNHRSASRIGYYRLDSSITDSPEKLNEIQNWAAEMLPKFYTALSDRFIAAQEQTISEEEH
jgi:CBS domain-containing protein